jgi:hypothetical protein
MDLCGKKWEKSRFTGRRKRSLSWFTAIEFAERGPSGRCGAWRGKSKKK